MTQRKRHTINNNSRSVTKRRKRKNVDVKRETLIDVICRASNEI